MNKDAIIAELREENTYLKAQIERLTRLIQGFKSERYVPQAPLVNQPTLFDTPDDAPVEKEETQHVSYERKKKKHNGRNQLPDNLPIKEVTIEPEEETTGLKKIGEEITETLEYTPASLVKKRVNSPKVCEAR